MEELEEAPDGECSVRAIGDHQIGSRPERAEERALRFDPLPTRFEPPDAQLPEEELHVTQVVLDDDEPKLSSVLHRPRGAPISLSACGVS
jgi:hypothetical protein